MKFGALATMAFVLFIGMAVASMAGLAPDSDVPTPDGIPDVLDNCKLVANKSPGPPGGCDTEQDGYGNICDGDFNQDLVVDGADFTTFKAAFKTAKDSGKGEDLNCDTAVDGADFTTFKALFKSSKVGPSGLGCAGPTAGGCPNSQ
jgi:hypothetical protein